MFKERLISGVILAAVLLAAVLGLSGFPFVLAVVALFAVAAWEWGGLTSLSHSVKIAYTALIATFTLIASQVADHAAVTFLLFAVSLLWLFLLALLAAYSKSLEAEPRWQMQLAALGLFILPAAGVAFVSLHALHFGWLLYLLLLCAVADSLAYFTGKAFGKTKLAPDLSPGKTREGMFGGILGVFALASLVGLYLDLPGFQISSFVLLSVLVGLVSVEGDLFESLLKREVGVKDSGRLLPGHGGVFDRFDSHIAAAPVFLLGLRWVMG